ncbi:MAG: hypothetical protein FWH05_00415 [Oscillospiraceae bacterium]|nr:hypothetical protein [Oscillospiraceae bacterium]
MTEFKKRIVSKKGELLLETIISILALGIMVLGISHIISISLNITGDALADAKHLQEEVINPVMAWEYTDSGITVANFRFEGITVSHGVTINVSSLGDSDDPYNSIIAFTPKVVGVS